MIKNEKSIIILRPIEEVFAYISDLQNAPQWQSALLESRRTTEGALGIGTQFTSVRKFMGQKMEATIEYVAYEPNHKIAFKSTSGSTPFEETYLFESTAEGTKLTSVLVLQSGAGIMGLADPLIAASVRREMEANFGDLKDMLESRITVALS
ncbi:MAG: hypothetical protein A2Z49_12115 [Chloroflexi bacterium RBG_19FT_COMBO_56_12]|nr:MAG: hypothetical protein A2Z49_12115 [Chloroflexi bacterium RBG_19FT_COMBO_56_12]